MVVVEAAWVGMEEVEEVVGGGVVVDGGGEVVDGGGEVVDAG